MTPSRRYPKVALGLIFVAWIVSAIGAIQPFDWFLESILVMLFVPLLVLTYRRFPLSDLSYTLILIFLCLHLVGAHWAYGAVPIPWEQWGFERNHYDRVVHFSFGLLMSYPIREAFYRIARARGFWGFFLPLDVTLSFSAVYEIIEWLVAAIVSPEAGAAFVGAQGDLFDPIKDMALAGTGAILTMGIAAWMNWRHNPRFRAELEESVAGAR